MGGTDVSTVEELMKILLASTIGAPLEIKYWRGDKEYMTTVTPVESPKPQS
jgi:S1-C subfamily serine protease